MIFIPYNHEIRKADRDGVSIIDVLNPDITSKFKALIDHIDQERNV